MGRPNHGHLAYKQSIMPPTSSSLFWRLKLIKLVSIRIRYGGTRAVLWVRKSEEATGALGKILEVEERKIGLIRRTRDELPSPSLPPPFLSALIGSLYCQ